MTVPVVRFERASAPVFDLGYPSGISAALTSAIAVAQDRLVDSRYFYPKFWDATNSANNMRQLARIQFILTVLGEMITMGAHIWNGTRQYWSSHRPSSLGKVVSELDLYFGAGGTLSVLQNLQHILNVLETESEANIAQMFVELLSVFSSDIYGAPLPEDVDLDEWPQPRKPIPSPPTTWRWMHGMPPLPGHDDAVVPFDTDGLDELIAGLSSMRLGGAGSAE